MAQKLRENCSISDDGEVSLGPALSEFILMERLFPPQQRAILMRNGRVEGVGMTISELGCFGAIVALGDGVIVHNEYAGFLLRMKFSGVDEGGVASGFAALSSPYRRRVARHLLLLHNRECVPEAIHDELARQSGHAGLGVRGGDIVTLGIPVREIGVPGCQTATD